MRGGALNKSSCVLMETALGVLSYFLPYKDTEGAICEPGSGHCQTIVLEFPRFQNYSKNISVVYELPGLGYFAIANQAD